VRTALGILLLAASLYAGWQFGKQRADHERAQAKTLAAKTDGSEVVAAAEAWKRYREAIRLGLKCEGDIGPHPIAAAAAMLVAAWYVLRAGILRERERAASFAANGL
jgi:hypothetical protein